MSSATASYPPQGSVYPTPYTGGAGSQPQPQAQPRVHQRSPSYPTQTPTQAPIQNYPGQTSQSHPVQSYPAHSYPTPAHQSGVAQAPYTPPPTMSQNRAVGPAAGNVGGPSRIGRPENLGRQPDPRQQYVPPGSYLVNGPLPNGIEPLYPVHEVPLFMLEPEVRINNHGSRRPSTTGNRGGPTNVNTTSAKL